MSEWMQDVCAVTERPPIDPAPGWELLAALRDLAAGDGGVAAVTEKVSAALADRDLVSALGACLRADRARVDGTLLLVAAIRGLSGVVKALQRGVRDEAERQEKAEREERARLASTGDGRRLLTTLGGSLRGYEMSDELVEPPGYEVDTEGVRRRLVDDESGEETLVPIATRPVVVVGRCRDVLDHTVTVVTAWQGVAGNWSQHTVSRVKVSDARALVALADLDAPFHSNNAADGVAYIASFEDANAAALPEALVSTTMGWFGAEANLSFLWGRHQVRGDGVFSSGAIEELPPARWRTGQVHLLPSDPGLRAAAEGFRAAGTFAGWVEVMRGALPYPRVMLGVFAAMVPPLMRFLPTLSNFVVDFSGVTSQGKTTTLRAAASVWGCPDERGTGILYTWDTTLVFAERIAALCNFVPLLLDDTKRARRREEVGRSVYNLASGVGRGRGSLQSIQRTTRTHTVLLSTGEESITSFTNDGGTRARCICVWGSPLGGTDAITVEVVQKLNTGVMQHYGHLGPALVQQLAGDAGKREEVRAGYALELERWTAAAGANGVASRAAQYVAAIAVAEHLFYAITGLPRPTESATTEAWTAVMKGASEADRATEALRQVLSWATSQQARFHGRLEAEGGDSNAPSAGWLGAWARTDGWKYLAILPNELQGFLDRQKYDTDAVLRTWDDRGWLLRDGRHLARKVTVGERKERCYAISREACDLATEGDDA